MKVRSFPILVGLGGSLVLNSAVNAAYMGLSVRMHTSGLVLNGTPRTVWRIYASFSDPGDVLTSVAGSPSLGNIVIQSTNPFATVPGGNFFNAAGGSLAPTQSLINNVPNAQWDTFATIGVAINTGNDTTAASPGFPGFIPGTSFNSNNAGWFTPGATPQGMAGNGINLGGGMWGVLIMQLTVNAGNGARGTVAIGGVHNNGLAGGTTFQTNADQTFWTEPAPGGLALFALVALGGRRSRQSSRQV